VCAVVVSTCGDDESLAGRIDVGLRPWQHPNARQLNNKHLLMIIGKKRVLSTMMRRERTAHGRRHADVFVREL
jgi:hypothetical protein